MIKRGPPDSGRVYLTFDDGPDPEWTPRVLDLLAIAGVKAAFFVIGLRARAQPALLRRIAGEGHELGNHTFSHAHPWTLPRPAAQREVRDGARTIADACGVQPLFFRPPHGRMRRCMAEQALADGQQIVLWSRSAVDWGPLGHAAAVARRLCAAKPGDILLMHDGARGPNQPASTCSALPDFLARLPARGLAPGALRELRASP